MPLPNIHAYPLTTLPVAFTIIATGEVVNTRGNYFEYTDDKNERKPSAKDLYRSTSVRISVPFNDETNKILIAQKPINVDISLKNGDVMNYRVLSIDQTRSNYAQTALDALIINLKLR